MAQLAGTTVLPLVLLLLLLQLFAVITMMHIITIPTIIVTQVRTCPATQPAKAQAHGRFAVTPLVTTSTWISDGFRAMCGYMFDGCLQIRTLNPKPERP